MPRLGPVQLIAEEWDEQQWGKSAARRITEQRGIDWLPMDMTPERKTGAGIAEEQRARRESGQQVRVPSDDIREQGWVENLQASGKEHVLVICGYLHMDGLIQKLKKRGHETAQRIYLESFPNTFH